MQLVNRDEMKVYEIYGVSKDAAGYPCFLVYYPSKSRRHKGQWRYISAKHFAPLGHVERRELCETSD